MCVAYYSRAGYVEHDPPSPVAKRNIVAILNRRGERVSVALLDYICAQGGDSWEALARRAAALVSPLVRAEAADRS